MQINILIIENHFDKTTMNILQNIIIQYSNKQTTIQFDLLHFQFLHTC